MMVVERLGGDMRLECVLFVRKIGKRMFHCLLPASDSVVTQKKWLPCDSTVNEPGIYSMS
jgi:hypothetical protein